MVRGMVVGAGTASEGGYSDGRRRRCADEERWR